VTLTASLHAFAEDNRADLGAGAKVCPIVFSECMK